MKNLYVLRTSLFLILLTTLFACGSDDPGYEQVSPVDVDLSTVPYEKLSQYKFFEGEMKNLKPSYKVLPYDLNSSLFTDYAHKKKICVDA